MIEHVCNDKGGACIYGKLVWSYTSNTKTGWLRAEVDNGYTMGLGFILPGSEIGLLIDLLGIMGSGADESSSGPLSVMWIGNDSNDTLLIRYGDHGILMDYHDAKSFVSWLATIWEALE